MLGPHPDEAVVFQDVASQFIQAAGKAAALKEEITKHGVPPHPPQPPPQVLAPGFMDHVTSDLSHAYTVAFVVAVGFALTMLIPAAFLPKKPAAEVPGQPAIAALAPQFPGPLLTLARDFSARRNRRARSTASSQRPS